MFGAKAFYDYTRAQPGRGSWSESEVDGCNRILAYAATRHTPTNVLAYIMATAHWEAHFQPVVEAWYVASTFEKAEAWRKRNLRYYPWHGRGLVQTTWERNYRALGVLLGHGPDFFLDDPDKLLEWRYALPALFVGMETGLYTGKSVSDYIDDLDESDAEDRREYINARRVVNGTDRAEKIANLAIVYEHGLRAAGYTEAVRDGYEPPVDPHMPVPAPETPADGDGAETAPMPTDGGEGAPEAPEAPQEAIPCWQHFARGFACLVSTMRKD